MTSPITQVKANVSCHCGDFSASEKMKDEYYRKACHGDAKYLYNNNYYCIMHYPVDDKKKEFLKAFNTKIEANDYSFQGVWFPDDVILSNHKFEKQANFNNARFSRRAIFRSATFVKKADFLKTEFLDEANFGNVTFSDYTSFVSSVFHKHSEFRNATFSDKAEFKSTQFLDYVTFYSAKFNKDTIFRKASFSKTAYFREATFGYVVFESATFLDEAVFRYAHFSAKTDFTMTKFQTKADFQSSRFTKESRAYFVKTSFKQIVDFSSANFLGYVIFSGEKIDGNLVHPVFEGNDAILDFQHTFIENPERFSFHTVRLHIGWFVNANPRKIIFTDVYWENIENAITSSNTDAELRSLEKRGIASPHRLLSISCNQLAQNSEENNHYEEASLLRYMSFEARRLEKYKGIAPWRLHWWYWLSSGYGERVLRAILVLMAIWFLSTLLYTQVGFLRWEPKISNEQEAVAAKRDEVGQPLSFKRAITYSLSVMALQKPEPKPATNTAHAIVILETILGPLQVALLALAIRRRFMR